MNTKQSSGGPSKAAHNILTNKWRFLAVFIAVLFITVSVCMATGFIPNSTSSNTVSLSATSTNLFNGVSNSSLLASAAGAMPIATLGTQTQTVATPSAPVNGSLNMNGDLPTKVVIPSINLSTDVANPATTNIDTLDTYLLKGAARYPTSATLDQQGNVIIFGHSSYLPIVINQHFKTFDGIQKLNAGDQITVYSATKEYVYAVQSVQQESAASDYAIPLSTTGHTLTLATCDSFGKKTDRFVVTATLVGSYALGS